MSNLPERVEDWPTLAPEGRGKPKIVVEQHLEPTVIIRPMASGQSTPAASRSSSLESNGNIRMEVADDVISVGDTSDGSVYIPRPTSRNAKRRMESPPEETTLTDSSVSSNNSWKSLNARKSRKVDKVEKAVQAQWELVEELDLQPLDDVEKLHREKMVEVICVAISAKNLKGTYVKMLRESATFALAAMTSSKKRIANKKEDAEKRALRLKNEVLQEKVAYLEKQLKKKTHDCEEEPSLHQRLSRARQRLSIVAISRRKCCPEGIRNDR